MNKEIVLYLKINKEKWIRKLHDEGDICFNRVGYFINKAETGKNDEQGDRYEGVFARLLRSDPRIDDYKNSLGDDLEIIDDDSHVFLRRKSVKNIPIFCMFGLTEDDLKFQDNEPILGEDGQLHEIAEYVIPDKMVNELMNTMENTSEVWGFYVDSVQFRKEVARMLNYQNIDFSEKYVAYDIDLTEEFVLDIPLDDSYSELFHKRKDYNYQHEIRYILPNSPTDDKRKFILNPLSYPKSGIANGQLCLKFNLIMYSKSGS